MLIIGNTLEETAYHEAGHIVVAACLGLDLRPAGITIWEAADNVADGLARYWEDESDWGKNLQAIRAGGVAQWRKFPESYIGGQGPDMKNFSKIVATHFPGSVESDMWQSEGKKADAHLDAHWSAVAAIAETLIASSWIPVGEGEHPLAKRKKELDGDALVAILSSHNIPARVRSTNMPAPIYERGDYVKVEFPDEATGIAEWMWVRVTSCDDRKKLVFGTLDNEPVNDYGGKLEFGSELAVDYSQIREHRKPTEFTKQ